MPRAKKNRPVPPTRQCAICEADFVSRSPGRKYCDEHVNQHAKRAVDRRKLGAKERPVDYYNPKICVEPECGIEFVPKTGSAKYCPEHSGRAWDRHNPDKIREAGRKAQRRYRHTRDFGDPDVYEKCVEKYGEQCWICGVTPQECGIFFLPIDHDHETMEIRGLLCPPHNTGLGYFQDSPTLLRKAADYLEG